MILDRLNKRSGNMTSLLPYLNLTGAAIGIMHNRNGTFEVGVEVKVPNSLFSGMGPILEAFRHLLHNGLSQGSRLRLIREVMPMPMGCLDEYKNRIKATESSLRHLLTARVAQFEEDWQQGHLRCYRSFVTVRIGQPAKHFAGLSKAHFAQREKQASEVVDGLVLSLKRAEFNPVVMRPDDIFSLCFRYFNPDYAQSKLGSYIDTHHYFPKKAVARLEGLNPSSLRAQLAKTPLSNAALGHLLLGKKFIKFFSLHTTPGKETYAGMMQAVDEAGSHYGVVTDVYVENSHKALSHITARARQFEAATFTEGYYVDPETRVLQRDSSEALEHSYDTGDRFFKLSVGLYLLDDDERRLHRRAIETYAALSGIPGNPFMPLSHGVLYPFLNAAPFAGRDQDQKVSLTTSNITHFMPVSGPWVGSVKPLSLYYNRYYGLTQVDPFDKHADAYNGLVIGQTGSGKTFFMQHLLSECLADNDTQVIIIDRGSGYKPLVEAAQGAVVDLKVGGSSINPFDLEVGKVTPSDEDKMLLLNLLRAMIPGEVSEMREIEDALLMGAISQIYSYAYKRLGDKTAFITPTLSDFVKKLYTLDEVNNLHMQDSQRTLARNLAMRLQLWIGDTALGHFVDRQTNVPLSGSRVIYYDTEGLRSHPQLKTVGTLLISQLVWKRVQAKLGQRTLVILDEGWAMVQGNAAGEAFVGEMFRRFRTTGSGIWAISQSYADFAHNPGIVNNVQNLLLLKSNADEREVWKRSLNLPQAVMDLAAQVTNVKGQFSQALYLVKRGERYEGDIIALHPTKLDYWTFTTDHQDKLKRQEMLASHGRLERAVDVL